MVEVGFVLLYVAPLVLTALAYFFWSRRTEASASRRDMFWIAGLALVGFSAACLAWLIVDIEILHARVGYAQRPAWIELVTDAGFVTGLAGLIMAGFGRGRARILLVVAGLLSLWLWIVVASR